MSKRAFWLAGSALCLGFIGTSCTGVDGNVEFTETAGANAAGGGSTATGTKTDGGTKGNAGTQGNGGNQADGTNGQAGARSSNGGQYEVGGAPPSSAGSGTEWLAGQAGTGGTAGEGGTSSSGEGGSTGEPVAGEPCEDSTVCKAGEYCQKPGCSEDVFGVCVVPGRPADPVCGCDGVTYFSGALARAAEADVRGAGVCSPEVAVNCEDEACPEGLTCGRVELAGGDCEAEVAGICWQLPKACPKEPAEYNECGTQKCASLCDAVTQGEHAAADGWTCAAVIP
jgi:hypothetical protein